MNTCCPNSVLASAAIHAVIASVLAFFKFELNGTGATFYVELEVVGTIAVYGKEARLSVEDDAVVAGGSLSFSGVSTISGAGAATGKATVTCTLGSGADVSIVIVRS